MTVKEIQDRCGGDARDRTQMKQYLTDNNAPANMLNESLYWNNRIVHSVDMKSPWVSFIFTHFLFLYSNFTACLTGNSLDNEENRFTGYFTLDEIISLQFSTAAMCL